MVRCKTMSASTEDLFNLVKVLSCIVLGGFMSAYFLIYSYESTGHYFLVCFCLGDELLFGTIEDQLGPSLCIKLHSIGWMVSQIATVRSEIDSVSEEVDLVFIYGGVGPLHSDVTVGGVAKAFVVRLVQIGSHSFRFDYVYGSTGSSSSSRIFDDCVAPLVDAIFHRYNDCIILVY